MGTKVTREFDLGTMNDDFERVTSTLDAVARLLEYQSRTLDEGQQVPADRLILSEHLCWGLAEVLDHQRTILKRIRESANRLAEPPKLVLPGVGPEDVAEVIRRKATAARKPARS